MGTIPIYWGEVEGGFAALINGDIHAHWARAQLEQHFELRPLDYLTAEALAPFRFLMMAQPRGLTPEENVALDEWVRAGGRLLLFADPAMTGHSHYPLGDRRRPQDTALLSPILVHWGLELLYDADQPHEPVLREFAGEGGSAQIPVMLAGQFAQGESDTQCTLHAAEILAFCAIGSGQAAILADAAMLDHDGPWPGAANALALLAKLAFGEEFAAHPLRASEPQNPSQIHDYNEEIVTEPDELHKHTDPPKNASDP